jgi:nicotinamide-nucleotide amidase
MRAAILSIGSELLQGFLTDTNATFLCQELSGLGVEVVGVTQVDDNLERIVRAFQRALADADVLVSTGGIGPTDDDMTREAIAQILGETPVVDPELAAEVQAFFDRRGVTMPEQNVKQAWVIPSSETLSNPVGTAPGWFVRTGDKIIVTMPGVPREMFRMWSEQAVPRIAARHGTEAIVSHTLKTIGIGESAVEQELKDLVARGYPVVATYAKNDGVHVRITALSNDRAAAEAAVDETEREIRQRLSAYVYGDLSLSLSSAILAPLAAMGEKVAVWEAGNAGRLAMLLGECQHAEDALETCVSVSYVAVDPDRAANPEQLAASGAREAAVTSGTRFGAAVVVSITQGETIDRYNAEVGMAFWDNGAVTTRSQRVTTNPPEIRRRATMAAAEFLWTRVAAATGGLQG